MDLLTKLFWPSATPRADRYGCFTRTAADDLKELGYGGTTEDEDEENDETKGQDEESSESDESEERSEDQSDENAAGEDDGEPDYKKRFINSQKQHLEDKKEMERLRGQISGIEQELTRLRTVPATTPTQPKTALNKDAFWNEINSISASDPEAKRKVVDKWVDLIERATADAVEKSRGVAKQEVENADARVKAYDQAKRNGIAALEKAGFSKEDIGEAFDDMEREVNHLMATNRGWFNGRSDSQQFADLADMVKNRWDRRSKGAALKANQEHERKAGGSIGGSRGASPSRKTSKGGDVKVMTFSQAKERDYELRKQMRVGNVLRKSA
jgi:hypothetical protein